MKSRLCALALACLLGAILAIPCIPFAPGTAQADETSAEAGVSALEGVAVSAEGEAAVADGASFALDGFFRAQKGSNRDLEGAYCGYCYYMGSSADYAVAIATEDYVVVHVPQAAAALCSASDESAQKALQRTFIALDAAALNGGVVLDESVPWHFTDESRYVVDGVVFEFGREVREGSFYTCVIAEDGTDAVAAGLVTLTHADFAQVVEPDAVEIALPPTGMEAFAQFLGGIDLSPLWVTLRTTGVAIVFIFVLGLAAAYFSLRIPKRVQDIADTIFTIPMVLPPTVCGFLLLWLLGNNTAFGRWLAEQDVHLTFSWEATVIAAVVVAFPLMYRSARGTFESLDANMLDAARTLGWSNAKIFFKLMLPLSWSSIAAGTVLAFARALGEFGATLFLAGNYAGITRTIPIAIYFEWMSGNADVAMFWTVVIIIFSFIVILFINLWSRRTTKYRRRVE